MADQKVERDLPSPLEVDFDLPGIIRTQATFWDFVDTFCSKFNVFV